MSQHVQDHGGWAASAQAWIASQESDAGDWSRAQILDPALETILADVAGLKVLDVGCGEGRYARKLAAKGALVTGIDPIKAFIDHAKSRHPEGEYLVSMAEDIPVSDGAFDIVLSYLTIIDIPDYRSAIAEMARVLKPFGRIVVVTISNMASTSDGWVKDASGRKLYRPVDRYMEEFAMDLDWNEIRIVNYHRPLSAILAPFFAAGLVLDGFFEPLPDPANKGYADEHRCPDFQIMTFRFGR